jgi:hypothetical protein
VRSDFQIQSIDVCGGGVESEGVVESAEKNDPSGGSGKCRSRFPEGMTERKAKANAEADLQRK